MEVLTYVPSNVSLIFSGYQLRGWDTIKLQRNSPSFKQIRGIRGKNTRTKINDTSATITISVPQTELAHEVFSKILEADIQTGNVRLEIALTDLTGSSLFASTTAYIVGYPTITYSSDIEMYEWTFSCEDSYMYVGAARDATLGLVDNAVSRLKDFVNSI